MVFTTYSHNIIGHTLYLITFRVNSALRYTGQSQAPLHNPLSLANCLGGSISISLTPCKILKRINEQAQVPKNLKYIYSS